MRMVAYSCVLALLLRAITGIDIFEQIFAFLLISSAVLTAVLAPLIIFSIINFDCPFCSKKVKLLKKEYSGQGNKPTEFICTSCGEIRISNNIFLKFKATKVQDGQPVIEESEEEEMTAISLKEYLKVLAISLFVPLFFAFIIYFEWHNSSTESKIAAVTLVAVMQILFLIPVYLYYPRKIDFENIRVIGKPEKSYSFTGSPFFKIKVKDHNKTKTMRVVIK